MHVRNKVNMYAYLDNVRWPLLKAMDEFLAFGRALEGELIFTGNWVYSRTDEEAHNNTGMNPVREPEAYLEYLKNEHRRKTKELGDIGTIDEAYTLKLPHAFPSPPDVPYDYYDQVRYRGGTRMMHSEQLVYASYVSRGAVILDLAGWRRLTELFVAWRVPRYIWFDAYLYELEGRIHKHRAWGGWLGWFAHEIRPADMPDGTLLFPIGPGTLVASQETQLDSADPAQVQRAQAVEIALVDLGILPTMAELIKASALPEAGPNE
ncbi:hypothetical protein AADZ90_000020 [Aestuariibius sp. 2305UL40-4]|uniref:hypothetical protein n=1 Tax=Aestuariibius violaceus TaxID=3234132 RepID=UPI00345F153A